MKLAAAALLLAACLPVAGSAPCSEWTLARSAHFEVYSQAGEHNAQSTLLWLERVRAFFVRAGVATAGADLERHGRVRVIAFKSRQEYAAYRPHPTADAYFLSAPARDYLVFPALGSQEFGIAAHEYAHLVVHSMGVQLRPWLAEGIAEFFSTVRIGERESFIGGDLPARSLALRQGAWIPLSELLSANSPIRGDAKQTDMFYAQSWALTDMFIFSPKYRDHLTQFLGERAPAESEAEAISRIYGKPLSSVMADLRAWTLTPGVRFALPGVPAADEPAAISSLSDFDSHAVLADLLLASDRLKPAEIAYRQLAQERPNDATAHAALAIIALRNGNGRTALEEWQRAMQSGIKDASLCYRFADLAEDAGLPVEDVRASLEQAILLAPHFDDARYKLGLLQSNAGNYAAAIEQLKTIHSVPAGRAYAYWTAMSSALTEADDRDAAKAAAANAMRYATTAAERSSASTLAYMAATDLTVQLARDAHGNLQVVTARKPHGSGDWNPFIEPGDDVRRVEGRIRKVECSAGKISGFRVENASTAVEVALPDPAQVLIRGGAPEFVCGAEDGRSVTIEYAASKGNAPADGILRGMQFR